MESLTLNVFASPAVAILRALEHDGFTVELEDDTLVIAPRSKLTPERMTAISGQKDALKTLLHCCDEGVTARRDVFRQQLDASPAGHVPAFLFRPGVAYVPRVCFSCGDALTCPRYYGRCWRCALAWRLACRVPVAVETAQALDAAKVVA